MKTISTLLLIALVSSACFGSIGFSNALMHACMHAATIIVPDNYPSIQEAIYAANPGDRIMVRNGTYNERVIVNQTVFLFSEHQHGAIVDGLGAGTVFTTTADNVDIVEFVIRNSGNNYEDRGIYLDHVIGCSIRNNILTAHEVGIFASYSNSNTILNNIFGNNYEFGIILSHAINNTIQGNVVQGRILYGGSGISLRSGSSYNILTQNLIFENAYDGIQITGSPSYPSSSCDYNIVAFNNVTDNSRYGIEVSDSKNNVVYHNNFVNNIMGQAICVRSTNKWDDGYPSGGNYWSDYVTRYPDANPRPDGRIWDTPYVIDSNNIDRFPLINPWIPPYIVTGVHFSLEPDPVVVGQTVTLLGNLTASDNLPIIGEYVTIKSNGSQIATLTTNSTGWFRAFGQVGSAGTFNVTVEYLGSNLYLPSSDWEILVVNKAQTEIYAKLIPNIASPGQTCTLKGILIDQFGHPIRSVTVSLQYSTDYGLTWKPAGTMTTNSYGIFTKAFTAPPLGTYIFRITYAGSSKHQPSTTDISLIVR